MGTTAQAGDVTIVPIYWVPAGFTMSAGYKTIVTRYLHDIAVDSGKASNVYAVKTEYSRASTPAGGDQIKYKLTRETPITDSSPFPAQECDAHDGFDYCITDEQVRTRIAALIASDPDLEADLSYLYALFFPEAVKPPPPPPPPAVTAPPPAGPPPPPPTARSPCPPKGCTVPKLFGQSYATAQRRLRAAACPRVTITRQTRETPKGRKLVVTVSAKAGTVLSASRTLRITFGFRKK